MCLIITPSPAHAPWQSHQINSLYKRLSLVLAKLFVHTSGLPSDPFIVVVRGQDREQILLVDCCLYASSVWTPC
jgi:hypothetical protein